MHGSNAAFRRSGNAPPTSCGLIRYSFAGSVRSGGGKSEGLNSEFIISSPPRKRGPRFLQRFKKNKRDSRLRGNDGVHVTPAPYASMPNRFRRSLAQACG